MGVLENSLITLENGDKIHVKDIKLNDDKLLTCQIEGLHSKSIDKEAIQWCKINPIIEKKESIASNKWKGTIDKYILVNGVLKLTFDAIVLFKGFEGETTWGYSKSLRKGYFLFTDGFEYEEIKSIKRVKGNVGTICLSADPYSCYFINGYLVHNNSLCDACDTCNLWPAILQPYGPHTHNSTANPVSTTAGLNKTQAQLYTFSQTLFSSNFYQYLPPYAADWQSNQSAPRTTTWNYFPQTINLKNNISALTGGYYHVVKYWDKTTGTDVGWKAYWSANESDGLAKAKSICTGDYGVPHDIFYYSSLYPSTPATTNRSFKICLHSINGVGMHISLDSGSTWNWYTALTNAGAGPSNITYSSQGPRGDSKIFVILMFPAPSSGYNRYLFRFGAGTTSNVFDPIGWSEFRAHA